jgi:hypothetical protein
MKQNWALLICTFWITAIPFPERDLVVQPTDTHTLTYMHNIHTVYTCMYKYISYKHYICITYIINLHSIDHLYKNILYTHTYK